MESFEVDLEKFDRHILGLFTLLRTVIKTHEKYKLNLSDVKNPILTRLDRYIKVYDKSEPNEHLWYFQQLYNKNKPAILRGPERDSWLSNGRVTLHFGEETGRPIKDAKIELSMIYTTAIKLRDDVEASLHGLPNVDQSQELVYPTVFLLHLYRIFYELTDNEDERKKLSGFIKDLESDAGIKTKSKSKSTDGDGEGLDGLMGMATGLMEQMGIKLPEGQKLPSGKDLNEAVGSVFKNPEAQSFIGDMMKDMQGSNGFGDIFAKLMNRLPATMDPATRQTLTNNAQMAINNMSESGNNNDNTNDDGEGDGDDFDDGDEFIDE